MDVYPNEYRNGRANTKLPNLADDDTDRKLNDAWRMFRTNANLAFLRALGAALPGVADTSGVPSLPVLLQAGSEREGGDRWYGSWDRISASPPLLRSFFASGEPYQDEVTQAKKQSKSALIRLPLFPGMTPDLYLRYVRIALANVGWDGFVLDAVSPRRNQPGPGNPLESLTPGPH